MIQTFSIHGLGVEIGAPADVAAVLARRLTAFASTPRASDLRLRFRPSPPPLGDAPGRAIGEFPSLGGHRLRLFSDERERCFRVAVDAHLGLELRRGRGVADIYLAADHGQELRLYTHLLFNLALIEGLKERGLLALHAAGFGNDARALLLFGASGCGKSTLSVALLQAGMTFLGDDMALLERRGETVAALPFPDELDLTDATLERFDALAPLRGRSRYSGGAKLSVRPEELFEVRVPAELQPTVLLFPQVAHAPTSVLRPLSRAEVLARLVPNLLLSDRALVETSLATLATLARQCRGYELHTGLDVFDGDALPARLRALLDGSAAASLPN